MGTFKAPYEQFRERRGQSYELLRFITEPDAEHDEEVLPMAVIRFEDGFETEAWPEELDDQDFQKLEKEE